MHSQRCHTAFDLPAKSAHWGHVRDPNRCLFKGRLKLLFTLPHFVLQQDERVGVNLNLSRRMKIKIAQRPFAFGEKKRA